MSNVCSLPVCCLALWFMALLLCCLLPQIPIAIHGQELSMSGPDAAKIGTSMNIAMAAIMNCNTEVTALCMPPDFLDNGQQALGTYMHMGHHMAKPKSIFGLRLPHHPSPSPRPPPPSHGGGRWPCPTLTTTTPRPRLGQVPPS